MALCSCEDKKVETPLEKSCSVEAEIQTVSRPYTNIYGLPVIAIIWMKGQAVYLGDDDGCKMKSWAISAVWELLGAGATLLAGADLPFPVKAKLYYRLVSPWTPLVVQLKDIKFPDLEQAAPATPTAEAPRR